jgi:LmbE family N-acetylglucosaminyl deacetylase
MTQAKNLTSTRTLSLEGRRLLFIGAHMDDIELGCGALMHSVAKRAEIRCVTLSDNRVDLPDDSLTAEHRASLQILGVEASNIDIYSFVTRRFSEARQDILDRMIKLRDSYMPDVVFTHSGRDIHQDHEIATGEVIRAFRGVTVLGFEILRSTSGFVPNLFYEVSEVDALQKVAALAQYQTYREKSYLGEGAVRSGLIRYGTIAEKPLAEAFDVMRLIS